MDIWLASVQTNKRKVTVFFVAKTLMTHFRAMKSYVSNATRSVMWLWPARKETSSSVMDVVSMVIKK